VLCLVCQVQYIWMYSLLLAVFLVHVQRWTFRKF
jgi:hypothetical protein